jgi:hypothetical protein
MGRKHARRPRSQQGAGLDPLAQIGGKKLYQAAVKPARFGLEINEHSPQDLGQFDMPDMVC